MLLFLLLYFQQPTDVDMPNISVYPVTTSKQQKDFFILAEKIYSRNSYWIPPLLDNARGLLGFKQSAFGLHNTVQPFIAYKDGEPVGRIAAIVNNGHLERYHDGVGFFGFFECINDLDVSKALFDTARNYLQSKGLSKMRGPCNPSLNYELGLLVDGFNSSPMFMMTYNLPYYEKLVKNYKFEKVQDLYAFWGDVSMLQDVRSKYLSISDAIQERLNVKIRPMDKKHFVEDVRSFLRLYNSSLTNTWGFVPLSDEEVAEEAEGLKYLLVPELALAAEIDNKVVGVSLCLPDYNPRIKKIRGRLFPFGWFHLLRNKSAIKALRIISTNVEPEYQLSGLGLVLLNGIVPLTLKWGIHEAEFSWVLESNHLSRGSLEKGGALRTKTYRIYEI